MNFSCLLLAIHRQYLVQPLLERRNVLEPLTVKFQKFDAHFVKVVDNIMIRYHVRSLLSVCSLKCSFILSYVKYIFTFSWIFFCCSLELLGCSIHHGEWFCHSPANKKLSLYWWSETQTFLNRSLVILPIFHHKCSCKSSFFSFFFKEMTKGILPNWWTSPSR